ncbi:PASTA domain-containing protein [Ruminococcaceae bacterium OttesenSCG-928-I18]|nr:PASTA domain-containing protein [Ruminococcaceae bacterium OttesenSCG-928-I18]
MRDRQRGKKENKAQRPMLLRCAAIGTVFVLAAAALSMRLFQLQVDEASEWQARASNQQLANIPIEPVRGVIYDSNMRVLAQSATVWTVEAAPNVLAQSKVAQDAAKVASRELAALLELDEAELLENLSDEESMYYRVKAKIEKPLADQVREMCEIYELSGIYLRQDSKRFYPYEELAATVLGFTDADGSGIEGLESYYNEQLAGTPGRSMAVRNAWGGEIPTGDEGDVHPAEDGQNIVLTIDVDIQQVAESYLRSAVEYHEAKERGMVVVMDVNTGAILAMATSPAYNPNEPYEIYDEATRAAVEALPEGIEQTTAQGEARTKQWRNKALADTYEPGSVLKVITAAAAVDSGVYSPDSTFHCGSVINVQDREFHCAQNTAHGTETLSQALIDSCNVSFVQMSAGMGPHVWYDYVNAFGLTEPTGVDLPGEPNERSIDNLLYSEDQLGPVELASCSFGQSNKYTALQMITAVSAAVNGGNLVQPHIVSQIQDAQGNVIETIDPPARRQVISPETSAFIASTLEELVTSTPNGQNAYVAGYHVGGKSGTSQKLELLTQEGRQEYISSFLGFAPANDPEIAVLVVLDESNDPHAPVERTWFGGRLAGPAAGNIIRETLQIRGVEPQFEGEEGQSRSTVSCPRLVDSELTSANVTLNQEGLTGVVVGGGTTVVAQCPEAYTQIPEGGQVVLYTDPASPQEMVRVPDLTGKNAKNAIDTLQNLGLNVLTTGAPDHGENVQVERQDVTPDTDLPKGSVVTLTMHDITVVAE